jgi:hypothetical protein
MKIRTMARQRDRVQTVGTRAAALVKQCTSEDPSVRLRARSSLVEMGRNAVPTLIEALDHPKSHVRWEAAKALLLIRDPRAAGGLASALADENLQVRWAAAEALVALDEDALLPLFRTLIVEPNSLPLREGVHHVLHEFAHRGLLGRESMEVLESLRGFQPVGASTVAAWHAFQTLLKKLHARTAV